MAALSDEVKQFIVQALACYDSPSQVADDVMANFGTQVPRQQVETYDPGRRAGRALSAKWRALFEDTRAQWRKEIAEIPIANRVTRLRVLNRLAVLAERKGNYALALQILDQAAKEVGGMYERRDAARHFHGDGAGDVPPAIRISRATESILRPDGPLPSNPVL